MELYDSVASADGTDWLNLNDENSLLVKRNIGKLPFGVKGKS